jgi:hypothetical protein
MRTAFMAVALVVAACVPWLPDHSPNSTLFQVEPRTGNDVVMWVVDETGLVTSAREADREPTQALEANARFELKEIDVRWLGGVCRHGPTVTLTGSFDALHIIVQPDGGPETFLACPAVGVFYGVTLTLSEPVGQEAIDVQEIR